MLEKSLDEEYYNFYYKYSSYFFLSWYGHR